MANLGELTPDQLEALLKRKQGLKVAFKTPQVEQEFTQVTPELKGLAETAQSPITVTSGKRETGQNLAVGGQPKSFHLTGQALDLRRDAPDSEIQRFKNEGYEAIDEGTHWHLEPSPEKVQRQRELLGKSKEELQGQLAEQSPFVPDFLRPSMKGERPEEPTLREKTVSYLKRKPLTMAGGMAGGLAGATIPAMTGVGAPLGLLTGPALAGLGAAGGRATENMLLGLLEPKERLPVTEALKEVGKEGAIGATNEAAFAPITAIGSAIKGARILKPLVEKTTRAVENIPFGIGPYIKSGREASELASKEAYQAEKEAAGNAFQSAEDIRKMEYQTGAADLAEQFRSQEAAKKAGHLARKPQALLKAKELKADEASDLWKEVITPVEEQFAEESVSAQPIRNRINDFLGKKGLIDVKGNIRADKIATIAAPDVKDFYSQLSSVSERLKTNPTISDLKLLKEEMASLRDKTKYSKDMVRQFDELYRGINESYDNLIGNLGGKELKESVKNVRSIYSSEKTMNKLMDSATSSKNLQKAIDKFGSAKKSGKERLKSILNPKQYEDLLSLESELMASEKPLEKTIKPSLLPFKPGERPVIKAPVKKRPITEKPIVGLAEMLKRGIAPRSAAYPVIGVSRENRAR